MILLSSCAFKSVILSNADYLVANRVGNKIDLSRDQEKILRKDIDAYFFENVSEVEKIRELIIKINITEFKIEKFLNDIYPIYETLYLKFIPLLSRPMSQFSKRQIKNLFEIAEEDNDMLLQRSKKDKTDEYAKRFKFFFGDLSKEQRNFIKEEKSIFQSLNENRLKNRLKTQSTLREAFELKDEPERLTMINDIFSKNLSKTETFAGFHSVLPLINKMIKELSLEQKAYFESKRNEVLDWIELFLRKYSKKTS